MTSLSLGGGFKCSGFSDFGYWLLASGSWQVVGSQQQEASDQQPVASVPDD
jgi:hypothetical protein